MVLRVYCENVELAVEVSALADPLGLAVETELSSDPLSAAVRTSPESGPCVAIHLKAPEPAEVIHARESALRPVETIVVVALSDADGTRRGIVGDLGFVCVEDVPAGLVALALLHGQAEKPFRASPRRLSAADRLRIEHELLPTDKSAGRLLSLGARGVAFAGSDESATLVLGRAADVASALRAIRRATPLVEQELPFELPSGIATARDVLFGPPRLLSDPASKSALIPFGLPTPQEELCTSASRAASEGARIGFPVRISLASPDLRIWDHPELSVDGVDNAARVRDVYRQLMAAASELAPGARTLGVTVTATTLACALLRISVRPLPHGRALARVGFADPHGATARDFTALVLPLGRLGLERALERLRGRRLLLGDTPASRDEALDTLSSLLRQLGSFVHALRDEVERVELNPVAVLVGGGAEIREAAVQVTDAFARALG